MQSILNLEINKNLLGIYRIVGENQLNIEESICSNAEIKIDSADI